MHREHDARPPRTGARPRRRTLLKSAAHGAWATPAVLAATTAPAYATSDTITVTKALYYWKAWTHKAPVVDGVAPLLTVRNDTNVATRDLQVLMTFPADYVGYDEGGYLAPRLSNWMGPGWGCQWEDPQGITVIEFYRRPSAAPFAPGQEITLGSWTDWTAFTINWTNKPIGVPISYVVTAGSASAPVSGVLAEVPAID
jgi:hypothetical protein